MPRESRREKLLKLLRKKQQKIMNIRHMGNPLTRARRRRRLALIRKTILKARKCRYGFVESVPRDYGFVTNVLPMYDEGRFKKFSRIKSREFQFILQKVENHEVYKTNHPHALPVAVQVAIGLYRLGNQTKSYTEMAANFAVGDGSSITRYTDRFIQAIRSLKNQFLYMPDAEERAQLYERSLRHGGLKGAFGSIDGTQVEFTERPGINTDQYYNKRQHHSMQVQLICDCFKRIRSVHAGFPGGTHDSRVFQNTEIYLQIDRFVDRNQYLVADKGYPLLEKVITPFRINSADGARFGFSENEMKHFNTTLSKRRVEIENVNGMVKEMFPSLKNLNVPIRNNNQHRKAAQWIECCCILYNMVVGQRRQRDIDRAFAEFANRRDREGNNGANDDVDEAIDRDFANGREAGRVRRAEILREMLGRN